MRPLRELDRYRSTEWEASMGAIGDDNGGCFIIPNFIPPKHVGPELRVIASIGGGWDHISVSTYNRCPTWEEMEKAKRLFFLPDEVAMQLHLPPVDHISVHPHCLHIWRPHFDAIPLPPKGMVA